MKIILTRIMFSAAILLSAQGLAVQVAIPGLIESSYQGRTAYTDATGDLLLVATAIDLGGVTEGLGREVSSAEAKANIADKLNGKYPDQVVKTGLPGIYELYYGGQVHYVDGSGRYVFKNARLINQSGDNLTARAQVRARHLQARQVLLQLGQIGDEQMLVYPAAQQQSWMTVFTDLDCPYCQRIHSELDTYKKAGITVKYLFFPRAGPDSEAYLSFVNVWCSANPYTALEKASAGRHIADSKACEHPVGKHLQLARELGLTATPVIILADGAMIYGYQEPATLIELANFHNNRK